MVITTTTSKTEDSPIIEGAYIQIAIPAVLFGVLLVIIFLQKRKLGASVRSISRSRKQGALGEKIAHNWLKRHGFKNIESQSVFHCSYFIDGNEKEFDIKPDFLAEKSGESWLIEVKTGTAASPSTIATRRQLREYAALFPEKRYALFDATKKVLHEVEFDETSDLQSSRKLNLFALLIAFLIGLSIAFII